MTIEQWGIDQWREILRMLAFRMLTIEQYPDPELDDPGELARLKDMWKDVQVRLYELAQGSVEE